MAEIASVNIENVTAEISEGHNTRQVVSQNIVTTYTHLNESKIEASISDTDAKCREVYAELVKQKVQKSTHFVKEAVILFKPTTTMADMERLAKRIEKELGIRTFQIHMHRDEGHYRKKKLLGITIGKEFVPNLHAHFVFNMQDMRTGKTIKTPKKVLSKFQDLAAEELGMTRGTPSHKKHISSRVYRLQAKETELKSNIAELKTAMKMKTALGTFSSAIIHLFRNKPKIHLEGEIRNLENKLTNTTNLLNNAENELKTSKIQHKNELHTQVAKVASHAQAQIDKVEGKLNAQGIEYTKAIHNKDKEIEQLKNEANTAVKAFYQFKDIVKDFHFQADDKFSGFNDFRKRYNEANELTPSEPKKVAPIVEEKTTPVVEKEPEQKPKIQKPIYKGRGVS